MKVMIRRSETGLSAYVPKKDLEEPIVAMEKPGMWGGIGHARQRLAAGIAGPERRHEPAHHRGSAAVEQLTWR